MDNTSRQLWQTTVAMARAEAAMVNRTRYAVCLRSGLFAGFNMHWTQASNQAQPFESMTAANAYAITALGLELDDYTVEAIS